MDLTPRANSRAGVAGIVGVTSLATFLANVSTTIFWVSALTALGALLVLGLRRAPARNRLRWPDLVHGPNRTIRTRHVDARQEE